MLLAVAGVKSCFFFHIFYYFSHFCSEVFCSSIYFPVGKQAISILSKGFARCCSLITYEANDNLPLCDLPLPHLLIYVERPAAKSTVSKILSVLLPTSQLHVILFFASSAHVIGIQPIKVESVFNSSISCLLPLPETKIWHHVTYVVWTFLFIVPQCCFCDSSLHLKEKRRKKNNQLIMFIRKSNPFYFPLQTPEETQISVKTNETNMKKKQFDKYIPFLNGCIVCSRQWILKCT